MKKDLNDVYNHTLNDYYAYKHFDEFLGGKSEEVKNLEKGELNLLKLIKNYANKNHIKIKPKKYNLRLKLHKILTNLAGSIILLLLPRIVQNKINKRYEILSEILPKIYKKEIEKTSKDEVKNLKKLFSKINSENIKDAIYAMSDGLVEVLSSISGLSGVFFNHLYVLVGGLIIGVSGTLSMTLGNFFSTLSEKEIEKNIDEKEKKQQVSQSTKITAIYYLIGAIIPLISFIANFGKYSLIIAYILTGIAVFLVNYLIEFISERSNKQIIIRSTLITLLTLTIAYIIYILGNLIRYYIPSL